MTPKPPRDDDAPLPTGSAQRRFPSTPRGVPIVERGPGQQSERDRYLPKNPNVIRPPTHPESWDDDATPVGLSDPHTYKLVRALEGRTTAQDKEIAVIKSEVGNIKSQVTGIDTKLDKVNDSVVRVAALMEADRNSITVTQTKMIASQTASTATKETLAEQVLAIEGEARKFKHRLWLKIAGGVFSGGVLTAIVALLARGC